MEEKWLPVVGYEDRYEVSNFGFVRNSVTKAILSPYYDKKGYLKVGLFDIVNGQGRRRQRGIHTLMLIAFKGPGPNRHECCHIDGNPANNRLDNLRWDSHRNNMLDRIEHGTVNHGERNGQAKLTREQIFAIRIDQRTQSEIGKEYGIAQATVSQIKTKARWGHI